MTKRLQFPLVAYAFAVTMLGTTLPTPLYPLYQRRYGFSEVIITVIFATYAVGVIAALVLFGRLSDEVGRRPVLLAGLVLSALSAVTFLSAGGLALLLVGRLLSGLSAGIFTGTATATLLDLYPGSRPGRASLVAAMANMGGLGLGPLLAGLLAQFAPLPLRLSFVADLALLLPAGLAVAMIDEPVIARPPIRLRVQSLHVPREIRAVFVASSLGGFAGFAVMGLSTAVSPAFLGHALAIKSLAVVGVVVFTVFVASLAGQAMLDAVPGPRAIIAGCGGLIAGMAVFAVGLAARSLALLIVGGIVAGAGQGLSFRAALSTLNAQAPERRRAQVASSFFVVAYVAISIPVISEGVLAEAVGLRTAGIIFATVVAIIAAVVIAALRRQQTAS